MPLTPGGSAQSAAWESRALDRSLSDARSRSSARARALVDAARGLAADTGSAAFTIADVAARAGVSLRSFYRHFAGKDELLLALFEEEAAVGASILAERIDEHADPLDRVRAYVVGLFGLIVTGSGYSSLLAREHLQLGEQHPDELRVALAPLIDLLHVELTAAAKAGKVRKVDHDDAVLLFSIVLAHVHAALLFESAGDLDAAAERLWAFCRPALTEGARKR
jgi:AcrR family transcriptional regulator